MKTEHFPNERLRGRKLRRPVTAVLWFERIDSQRRLLS